MLSGALKVALVGIAVGLLGAMAATSIIGARASGLDLDSPLTLVLTAVGLLLLVLAAAFVPGRRAAGVSPLVALRSE